MPAYGTVLTLSYASLAFSSVRSSYLRNDLKQERGHAADSKPPCACVCVSVCLCVCVAVWLCVCTVLRYRLFFLFPSSHFPAMRFDDRPYWFATSPPHHQDNTPPLPPQTPPQTPTPPPPSASSVVGRVGDANDAWRQGAVH